MCQLYGNRNVGPAPYARECARHSLLGGIVPQAHVGVGNARFTHHGGRLDRQKRSARESEAAEMNHMPVGHAAINGGVLAHGSDDDAVDELELADACRAKQSTHEITCQKTMMKGSAEHLASSAAALGP